MLSVETQGNSINVTFLYNKIEVSYKVKIYLKYRVCKYNCVKATFFINITSDG